MKALLIVRLLASRGAYHLQTRVLGNVEIRHQQCDLPGEREALRVSRVAFKEPVEEPDLAMRIATLIDTEDRFEAEGLAAERFEEALDVAGHESPLSRWALSQAGCITTLRTGHVQSRQPFALRDRHSTTFMIRRGMFESLHFDQWLLGAQRSDLATRLLRSYHWSRKASDEANRQLRILFRWFSMETIWTLPMAKNDDICPRILWSLGFPNGSNAATLSAPFLQRLHAHPRYQHWRAEVKDRLYQVKDLRNNSVHSGFRAQDVPSDTLRSHDHLTMLSCGRVQRMAVAGLQAGLQNAQELYDYSPVLLQGMPHAVDDLHGTVIFGLEDPNRFRWEA